jgi:hypothetical protein
LALFFKDKESPFSDIKRVENANIFFLYQLQRQIAEYLMPLTDREKMVNGTGFEKTIENAAVKITKDSLKEIYRRIFIDDDVSATNSFYLSQELSDIGGVMKDVTGQHHIKRVVGKRNLKTVELFKGNFVVAAVPDVNTQSFRPQIPGNQKRHCSPTATEV